MKIQGFLLLFAGLAFSLYLLYENRYLELLFYLALVLFPFIYYYVSAKEEVESKFTRLQVEMSEINSQLREEMTQQSKVFTKIQSLYKTGYDILCAICQDNKSNTLFRPCRHVCCCEKCQRLVTECPLCRQKIKEREKIYIQ